MGRSGGAAAAAGWKIGTVVGSNTDKNEQVRELELTAKNVHNVYGIYVFIVSSRLGLKTSTHEPVVTMK